MNILRRNRKRTNRISKKRYLLLIFLFIMSAFAWITYSRILDSNFQVHINSWNIELFIDKNQNGVAESSEKVTDKTLPINIELLNLYPGMDEDVINVIIQNNGETPSKIAYTIKDNLITLIGKGYKLVDDVESERATASTGEYFVQKNTFSDPVDGIITYELINELDVFPFKIIIEHTEEIEEKSEGFLKVKVVWPLEPSAEEGHEQTQEEKDSLDTEWGYGAAEYIEDEDKSPVQFDLIINAIGLARSSEEILGTVITSANYGDYVNYSVDLDGDGNTTDDWRIFYTDNNRVFLIAADYIPITLVPSDTKIIFRGTHVAYYSAGALSSYTPAISNSVQNKYLFSRNGTFNVAKHGYKTTSKLLDTNIWSSFAETEFAESAIGGPTIEMFVESWNKKYPEEKLYCNNGNSNGYFVGKENEPTSKWIYINTMTGYNNTLYVPHKETKSDCYGYWIASPSATEYSGSHVDKAMCLSGVRGTLNYGDSSIYDDLGIRPVVSLKKYIYGTKDASDVWQLSDTK